MPGFTGSLLSSPSAADDDDDNDDYIYDQDNAGLHDSLGGIPQVELLEVLLFPSPKRGVVGIHLQSMSRLLFCDAGPTSGGQQDSSDGQTLLLCPYG